MMSIFRIPDGLLDEMHSMLARFWWGSSDTRRKMHWLSWEKLCLPKSMGGRGFRDLKFFNQALLAKQGWRLLCNMSSLDYQVVKAKYFKNGKFVDAPRGHDLSYVWRSLWGEKALLLDEIKWRMGNGSQINVWGEAWLPGDSSCVVPTPNVNSPANLKVADLIDEDLGEWNVDASMSHFIDTGVVMIREIPLNNRSPTDVNYWWPTNDGIYTTKSGYWLGRLGHITGWARRYSNDNQTVWKLICNIGGPPKLCHFLWRACRGALATQGRLLDRHVVESGMCILCGEDQESIIHALFLCPEVAKV